MPVNGVNGGGAADGSAGIGARRLWLEQLIFGGEASRRFTQDSPVLPDVWIQYGRRHLDPDNQEGARRDASDCVDLLLTPHRGATVPELSQAIRKRLVAMNLPEGSASPEVAYNQATVAARLTLKQLVRIALPLSLWWRDTVQLRPEELDLATGAFDKPLIWNRELLVKCLRRVSIENGDRSAASETGKRETLEVPSRVQVFVWLVRVVGTLALVKELVDSGDTDAAEILATLPGRHEETVEAFLSILDNEPAEVLKKHENALLWTASLNRTVRSTIAQSTLTVKADAARQLFQIDTGQIAWAVIDSGIDSRHPAFLKRDPKGNRLPGQDNGPSESRVQETYDFTRIRSLLTAPSGIPSSEEDPEGVEIRLRRLRRRLNRGQALDWGQLRELLQIPARDAAVPKHDHGTHVAGILAGNWPQSDGEPPPNGEKDLVGVAPTLLLYDLRVLDENGVGSEFSVLAALQFIRWLNTQYDEPRIHGANLSLSMKHDVANYACGRTPVCEECERVSSSGVVVVAAAGNDGYARFTTPTGDSEGYRSISIADPGNADAVITVGATHRNHPHSYGVSYFSSRGPTGDGRRKPDIVAPGEKITAPTPNGGAATKDGTSMAAPHVSGAAALLMARHRELRGHPQRIKEILCSTATDLQREPYFQGHGLVDILRALQSV